jgi:hypothetical protein
MLGSRVSRHCGLESVSVGRDRCAGDKKRLWRGFEVDDGRIYFGSPSPIVHRPHHYSLDGGIFSSLISH